MDTKRIRRIVLDYVLMSMASFIFAMAWECFMIPNGMSAGGMMGLCTILQYATGGFIQAQYSYIAINAILIIIAVLTMGIGFGFRTIYCIALSTLAMQILHDMTAIHCIPGSFFYVRETLLIPIIAGALEAMGIGLVLRYGGSTGGTDIIALMINKYWPVSLSSIFLATDIVICSLLLFLPDKTFADMCYGVVEFVIFTLMIDTVVGGKNNSYQIMVFSEKYKEIADHIINNMDRGATILKAQGWYTKKDRNVVLMIIGRKELQPFTRTVKDLDPRAFMSISPTNNVYGEGFEQIKAGVSLKSRKNG